MASRRRLCLLASIVMTAGLVFTGCGIQPEEPPLPSTPVVIPTATLPDTFTSALELSARKTTLEEASEAVEFPISIQLPRYMPEGTEPPFVGLTVTPEEPHGVTVHYSTFQVTMVPEPGVTGPPPGAVGEWITIRKKQVLVGENRVDWWVYDIHYSIVSDQVPIEEQIIVAESMMLIAPGAGSWLDQELMYWLG